MLIRMDIYDMEIISGVKVTHAMLEKRNVGWQKEWVAYCNLPKMSPDISPEI